MSSRVLDEITLPAALRLRPGLLRALLVRTMPAAVLVAVQLTCTDQGGAPLGPADLEPQDTVAVSAAASAARSNAAPVAVIAEPVACDSLTCAFDGTGSSDADGSIMRYRWDNGAGGRRAGETLSTWETTYTAGGTYTASLVVTDDAGATDTARVTLTVPPPDTAAAAPEAVIAVSCTGTLCALDGTGSTHPSADHSIVSWSWEMGDPAGTVLSGATASHNYAADGTYAVTLTVTGSDSLTASATDTVTVRNAAPAASVDSVVCAGPACTFHGHGSSDADGTIAVYSWRFGDGGYYGSPGLERVSHTYADTAATYTATLAVTDDDGAADTVEVEVEVVISDPPVAGFSWACAGRVCTFTSTSTGDAGITSYAWDFGDGGSRAGPSDSVATHEYSAGGTYTVALVVADAGGQADTVAHDVRVNTPPVAAIAAPPSCDSVACTFDATASSDPDGEITLYSWDFGDGGTRASGTLDRPVHTYPDSVAAYAVTLVVTDDGGATDTAQVTVTVSMPPVAGFDSECDGSACSFQSTSTDDLGIVSYAWDFGDGETESGAADTIVAHTYETGGAYAVTLVVVDAGGQTASATDTVRINQPPVAAIAWPASCDSVVCTFDGSGSHDPDGSIANYAWDFGDGARAGETLDRPVHTYPDSAGAYTVTLVVTDDAGAADTAQITVTISMPPAADFTWSCNGNTCAFTSTSTDDLGAIATYAWDFGDGSPEGSGPEPEHTYGTPGTYDVTLVVADAGGQTDSATHAVRVNAPPVASIDSVTCAGTACTFHADGSSDPDGTIVLYAWDYGNGTRAGPSLVNPTRMYPDSAAIYTVVLTVTDNDGASGTDTATVVLSDPPTAGFEWRCDGRACAFWSMSTDDLGITSYAWDFGDGSPAASDSAPDHAYATSGTYDVTLIVADAGELADTVTHTLGFNAPPAAQIAEPVDCLHLDCRFDGSASTDPDGSITSYAWDFGDTNSYAGASLTMPAHTYPDSAGTYTVTLTVTDDQEASDTDTVTVTVAPNQPPEARFTWNCGGPDPLACTFDGTSSSDDGGIESWTWDFGDASDGDGAETSRTYANAGSYEVTLTVADGLGLTGDTVQTVVTLPVIGSFAAAPSVVTRGGSARLTWQAEGAETLRVTPAGGEVTDSTGITVTPENTTTYTLTATNAAGVSVTDTTTVTVVPPPVINWFRVDRMTITEGDTATLSWDASAGALSIDQGIGTVNGSSARVAPPATTTYTLTALNQALTSVTVTVTVTVVPPPVIDSFAASPDTIPAGGSATLSWETRGATSLGIDPAVGDVTGRTTATVEPSAATTYTLTAANAAGASVTAETAVAIVPPPVIDSFAVAPDSIPAGGSATLSWTVQGADALSIAPGVGDVTGSTSATVTPDTTTTFTLTASNIVAGVRQTTEATLAVTVVPPPAIDSFHAADSTVTAGTVVTLTYATTNATTVLLRQGTDDTALSPGSGTADVTVDSTTTYELVARNSISEQTSRSVTIETGDPPAIEVFYATHTNVRPYATLALIWQVENADAMWIDQGVGAVTNNTDDDEGYVILTPTQTATYTLYAANVYDTVTAAVTVTVTGDAQSFGFAATQPNDDSRTSTSPWPATGAGTRRMGQGPGSATTDRAVVTTSVTTQNTGGLRLRFPVLGYAGRSRRSALFRQRPGPTSYPRSDLFDGVG